MLKKKKKKKQKKEEKEKKKEEEEEEEEELYRLWENKNVMMKTKAHIFNSNVKSALF